MVRLKQKIPETYLINGLDYGADQRKVIPP